MYETNMRLFEKPVPLFSTVLPCSPKDSTILHYFPIFSGFNKQEGKLPLSYLYLKLVDTTNMRLPEILVSSLGTIRYDQVRFCMNLYDQVRLGTIRYD